MARESLRAYRLSQARAKSQPAFCIFSGKVLDAICDAMPRATSELQRIKGIGPAKILERGADIIRICSGGGGERSLSVTPAYGTPSTATPAAQQSFLDLQQHFRSTCGHTARVAPVPKAGGKMEGKWQIRVKGPRATGASGAKCLYSDANISQALAVAAQFLGALPSSFSATTATDFFSSAAAGAVAGQPAGAKRLRAGGKQVDLAAGSSSWERPRLPSGVTAAAAAATMASATPAQPNIQASELLVEQSAAADRALSRGENLFITGPAGAGKSFLLRFIIQGLQAKHPSGIGFAVTAPTGIAAVNIGGVTIHSFAGIGLGRGDPAKILSRVQRPSKATASWINCQVLVIDEVSMLSAELFDLLGCIGKTVRRRPGAPFGGAQLILCGDFLQLPPVTRVPRPYCFQSTCWPTAGLGAGTIHLRQPRRQASDPTFVMMLNSLRRGVCNSDTSARLAARHVGVKPPPTDGILPTKLCCANRDVDAENAKRLEELGGRAFSFPAHDVLKGAGSGQQAEDQLRDTLGKKIAQQLGLKIGAQVVLLRNLSDTLANGSRGVVVGFEIDGVVGGGGGGGASPHHAAMANQQCQQALRPRVKLSCGITKTIKVAEFWQGSGSGSLARWQLPLKLGWALTARRAQGMTLSRVELQIDGALAPGQARVALSRATGMDGLWMRSKLSANDVRAGPGVLAFYDLI